MPSHTEDLVASFCDLTLPKERWTHEAHLRVGLWHVLHHDPPEALALIRQRITAYNEATGVENSDDSGYHETITRFFLHEISRFLHTTYSGRPIDDLAAELIALLGNKETPLRYYSRDRLMSVAARRGWVEPDLQPLPSHHVAPGH
jgi:hypothetical protein